MHSILGDLQHFKLNTLSLCSLYQVVSHNANNAVYKVVHFKYICQLSICIHISVKLFGHDRVTYGMCSSP